MARNKSGFGRAQTKGGGGGGRRRKRRRGWARDCSGSDDPSDEEYVVGLDEEGDSSFDSYSSDASREASVDACSANSCSEEEEEALESEYSEEEEVHGVRGTFRQSIRRKSRVKRRNVSKKRRNVEASLVPEEDLGPPPPRKARAITRQTPVVFQEEEEEYDDDKDEDFAPDEDEAEEEDTVKSPVRKTLKQQNATKPGERKKAPARRRNSQVVRTSDDEAAFVEEMNNIRARVRGRKRRKAQVVHSDSSDSDSSDVDFEIAERKLGNLQAEGPGRRKGKGKGKEVDTSATQICGICLTEERKEVIRGLLDCCSHFFCFACIMEWSKVESKCPICKRRFKTVSKAAGSDSGLSLRTTVVRIPKRDQVYQPSEEEIRGFLDPYANVVCIECQQGGDDSLMLLCDVCDSPAHTYCVGLGREVPEGNWYCNGCRSTDPASTSQALVPSLIHHQPQTNLLQEIFRGETGPTNSSVCPIHELHQHQDETPLRSSLPSGMMASTLFGRRSIHRRIRMMLFNDRNRRNPEEFSRNGMIPAMNDGVNADMDREMILMNGRDESHGRMNMWSFSEGINLGAVESSKEHVQS